ncbi:MAG: metallophosphoesterase [Nanoarchaeota archaeon]
MNVLAFVDTHADKKKFDAIKKKAKEADVILCAGDLSVFENNYEKLLKELDEIGVQTFIIHGNHETERETLLLTKNLSNVLFIHKKVIKYKDYYFFGWGGGGFNDIDSELEHKQKEFENAVKGKQYIFISHAPPYNTPLDHLNGRSVGNKTIRKFIEHTQPRVAISGHIHEVAKATGKIGKSFLANPGPDGMLIKINQIP